MTLRTLGLPGQRGLSGPEIFVVVSLLVLGLAACFLVPYGAGFDEETHLLRVWELSALRLVPNEALSQAMPYPAVFWDLSYRRRVLIRPVEPDFWAKYGSLPIDAHDYIYNPPLTRSVYSPPLLGPQALVMRYLGRRFLDQGMSLPALTVFYACRFAGLLTYLGMAWLAVRLVPYGKWLMALAAVSPMALFQAATINADAVSNGIGLLYIGGCLALSRRTEIRWREWGALAFLTFLLFLAKVNLAAMAVLPFVLLSPSRFRMRGGYVLLLGLALLMLVVEVGGWNAIAYSVYRGAMEGADPVGQMRQMLAEPLAFPVAVMRSLAEQGDNYLREWIGVYGYGYWSVPGVTYVLYGLAVVGALLSVSAVDVLPTVRERRGLAAGFAATVLATVAVLYVTYTPVGRATVEGLQGRYFTPVMPLLFLAMVAPLGERRFRRVGTVPLVCGTGSLIAYMAGLVFSYHIPCGTQYYNLGLCYQPLYKNWAPNESYSSPLSREFRLSQEIVPECNGLAAVRVWIDASQAPGDGTTEFLFRDTLRDRDLVIAGVPNSQLPAGGWYELTFDPDWESAGKVFFLKVQGSTSPSAGGARVAYTLRPEYLVGKLYENEAPVDVDLVFQYGCVAGLEKFRRNLLP